MVFWLAYMIRKNYKIFSNKSSHLKATLNKLKAITVMRDFHKFNHNVQPIQLSFIY